MESSSSPRNLSLGYAASSSMSTTSSQYLGDCHTIALCTLLGVASLLGTFGNALVLSSIIKFDNLHEIPDFFIFSLSLSDLLVTALYQPLRIYRITHLEETSENMMLMQISSFLGFLSLIASISNIFGVTVERLISIRFPLKYDLLVTRKRAMTSLICVWIFSTAHAAIVFKPGSHRSFTSIFLLVLIAGTTSIYVYLFTVAKRIEAAVNRNTPFQNENNQPGNGGRHKAAKTIAIILAVALLCWVPFLIATPFLRDSNRPIFLSLQALSVCNSSINPYIYCARSQRFYEAFLRLLGLRRRLRVGGISINPVDPVSRPACAANQIKEPRNETNNMADVDL